MEKMVPSFLKTNASPCYYSGNRRLRNIQASTPLFTNIHGPHLHEKTSKNEDVFESLTENVSVCTISKCTGENIEPMAETLKNIFFKFYFKNKNNLL